MSNFLVFLDFGGIISVNSHFIDRKEYGNQNYFMIEILLLHDDAFGIPFKQWAQTDNYHPFSKKKKKEEKCQEAIHNYKWILPSPTIESMT